MSRRKIVKPNYSVTAWPWISELNITKASGPTFKNMARAGRRSDVMTAQQIFISEMPEHMRN